ncbi:MAG: nucleotidyltransferase [Candidatus Thorarchaeota archaeon]|nr:nucleotidyltransferase [Candidatus Thorarchaeota archaeon]
MDEFPEILQYVCSYLNEHNIDYVIVGGVAVMYHGVPRTTVDIDLLLEIDESAIVPFSDFLSSKGFVSSAEDLRAAFAEHAHSTIFYCDSALRLDIQGINSQFDQMTIDRAVSITLFDVILKLGTVEDTLINKILFQGEQDLRDAHGIYRINQELLNLAYIEDTCKMLGIFEKWTDFLTETAL